MKGSITGVLKSSSNVFHIPAHDLEIPILTMCGTKVVGRFQASRFEHLNDPNLCKHCSMKAYHSLFYEEQK